MKNKKKILSPYKRKIHISNEEWTYDIIKSKMGSSGYLKVCNPDRTRKYNLLIPELGKSSGLEDLEWCPEEFDGEWEEVYSVSITPSIVKDLIQKKIINS